MTKYEVQVTIREMCCAAGYHVIDKAYIIDAANEAHALSKVALLLKGE